jgi:hypothetical protein
MPQNELGIDEQVRFTQAVLAMPYSFDPNKAMLTEKVASSPLATVHNETMLLTAGRWALSQMPSGSSPEEWGGEIRGQILAEEPVRLRRIGRALMRLQNEGRFEDTDVLAATASLSFREIAEACGEDEVSLAIHLRAAGYFGMDKLGDHVDLDALNGRRVPADALHYIAVYPPATLANPDERTTQDIAEAWKMSGERVRGILGRTGIPHRPWNLVESIRFGPDAIAAIAVVRSADNSLPKVLPPDQPPSRSLSLPPPKPPPLRPPSPPPFPSVQASAPSKRSAVPEQPGRKTPKATEATPAQSSVQPAPSAAPINETAELPLRLPGIPKERFTATINDIARKFSTTQAEITRRYMELPGARAAMRSLIRIRDPDRLGRLIAEFRLASEEVSKISQAITAQQRTILPLRRYGLSQISMLTGRHPGEIARHLQTMGRLAGITDLTAVSYGGKELDELVQELNTPKRPDEAEDPMVALSLEMAQVLSLPNRSSSRAQPQP